MLSSNLSLRKAYFTALSNITYNGDHVPVYWSQLPSNLNPGIYIVYGQIRNVDNSNKTSPMTETSVTVSVYTNNLKYNNGEAVEIVSNEVLNRILKNTTFSINLPDSFFVNVKTSLLSDITQDFSEVGANVYLDRILTFNHTIFQNVS